MDIASSRVGILKNIHAKLTMINVTSMRNIVVKLLLRFAFEFEVLFNYLDYTMENTPYNECPIGTMP